MDELAIICDKVIESYNKDAEAKSCNQTKTILTDFNEKKGACKTF